MGEQYTICDPYLFTIGTWLEGDGVDTTKLPRIMEHRKTHAGTPRRAKSGGGRRHPDSLMRRVPY